MPDSQSNHTAMTSHQEALAKLKHDMRISSHSPTKRQPAPKKPTAKQKTPAMKGETTALHEVEYPSRALYLINAWRMHGHLKANLDPLKLNPPHIAPDMELGYYGLSEKDLDADFPTGDLVAPPTLPLRDILNILENTYSGHIAPELMHISDTARRNWLQHRLEGARSTPDFASDKRNHIFNMIMKAEAFERFLDRKSVV